MKTKSYLIRSTIYNKFLLLSFLLLIACPLSCVHALPQLPAEEGIYIVEQKSGDVLYSQNADDIYYPASTTKLMTALVMCDNVKDLNERIVVGDEVNDYTWADSKADLWQGQNLSYQDLLYALLIPSGNDASGTIAINVGRKLLNNPAAEKEVAKQAFIDAMNQKAKDLGLVQTHFVNPSGMYDPNHYTTPREMSIIAQNAFANDSIRNACSTKFYELPGETQPYRIKNTNLTLYNDANEYGRPLDPNAQIQAQEQATTTADGQTATPAVSMVNPYRSELIQSAKTGSTDEGGRTFVFKSNIDGADVLGVIFKTSETGIFEQAKAVVDNLNADYELMPLSEEQGLQKRVVVEETNILDGNELDYGTNEEVLMYLPSNKIDSITSETRWDENFITNDNGTLKLANNIEEGQKIGSYLVLDENKNVIKTVPVYAKNSLRVPGVLNLIIDNIWIILGTILLIGLIIIFLIKRRSSKRKHNSRLDF